MTRIAFLSDTHNKHRFIDVPPVDMLIHCGDFSFMGKTEELADFNDWIGQLKAEGKIKKCILTPGNHDIMLAKDRQKAESILGNVDHILIHGCAFEFGLKIWGCSYVPIIGSWVFMKEESQLYFIYNQIPVNFDIVICHGPPRGILDRFDGQNVGSSALAEVIKTKAPKVMACGHIHSGRGIEVTPETTYINCAMVNESYQPLFPIILDV